jgi:hypothetical protein
MIPRQSLEALPEWNELFPLEPIEVEPESARKHCINVDLGLDQMEDYEPI